MSGDFEGQPDVGVTRLDWRDIQRFVGLTETDLQQLAELRPLAQDIAQEVADRFYGQMSRSAEMMAVVNRHSSIERLKRTFKTYFVSLFDGVINEQYVRRREAIGRIHQEIGVPPDWYAAMFPNLVTTFLEAVQRKVLAEAKAAAESECRRTLAGIREGLQPTSRRWWGRMPGRTAVPETINLPSYEDASTKLQRVTAAFQRILAFDQMVTLKVYTEQLRTSLDQTDQLLRQREQMREAADRILEISSSLSQGMKEATSAVTHLAEASENQAQVAADASTVAEQVAQLSREGLDLANRSAEAITSMLEQVAAVVQLAREAESSTEKIREFTKQIEEIAEQTNLLALNAAIEAARAGEQGRGFSVVADEVRKLAERNRNATKSVQELAAVLGRSSRAVVETSTRTDQGMREVTSEAAGTSESFQRLATAAADLRRQMDEISRMATANAAATEELSAGVEEVAARAEELRITAQALLSHRTAVIAPSK